MALWLVIRRYAQMMKRRKVAEATVILLVCSLNSHCAQRSWQTWWVYLDYLLSLEVDSQAERQVLQSIFYHIVSICSRSYVALIFCGDYTLTTGTIACTS
jgi:hypothetical protein